VEEARNAVAACRYPRPKSARDTTSPHIDAGNVERILDYGFRWLMQSPERTFRALDLGRRCAGGA